ncbi:MAG: class I SAM-dependent methyltransferase [Candidatus Lokiarchaeota archaeon]|nr:class I SAM-dependent methyltransferase [Candidatus Lokiarchaeota archaeon]
MVKEEHHYYSKYPDSQLKVFTISESLRRHLFLFKTTTGIFSFRKIDLGTKILIENMTIPEKKSILLDLGCGYGPIGIVLGYYSHDSEIYFIDSNKRAIWCTKENVKLNLPELKNNMHIFSGDYFESLKNKDIKFDIIYMNPPLRKGKKEFFEIFDVLPFYLKKGGLFEFVIRKKMGAPHVYKYLLDKFKNKIKVKCKRSGFWIFQYSFV